MRAIILCYRSPLRDTLQSKNNGDNGRNDTEPCMPPHQGFLPYAERSGSARMSALCSRCSSRCARESSTCSRMPLPTSVRASLCAIIILFMAARFSLLPFMTQMPPAIRTHCVTQTIAATHSVYFG